MTAGNIAPQVQKMPLSVFVYPTGTSAATCPAWASTHKSQLVVYYVLNEYSLLFYRIIVNE